MFLRDGLIGKRLVSECSGLKVIGLGSALMRLGSSRFGFKGNESRGLGCKKEMGLGGGLVRGQIGFCDGD